jgi:hypothetical protein
MTRNEILLAQYTNTVRSIRHRDFTKKTTEHQQTVLKGYLVGLDFALTVIGLDHEASKDVLGLEEGEAV